MRARDIAELSFQRTYYLCTLALLILCGIWACSVLPAYPTQFSTAHAQKLQKNASCTQTQRSNPCGLTGLRPENMGVESICHADWV